MSRNQRRSAAILAIAVGLFALLRVIPRPGRRERTGPASFEEQPTSLRAPIVSSQLSDEEEETTERSRSLPDEASQMTDQRAVLEPLALRFVDVADAPIAARVPFELFECSAGCLSDLAGPGTHELDPAYVGESDFDGAATVPGLGHGVFVVVTFDDHYVVGQGRVDYRDGRVHLLPLGEGVGVTGMVFSADGRPVAGARVGVQLSYGLGGLAATTCLFDQLPEGQYRLRLVSETATIPDVLLSVRAGERKDEAVLLHPVRRLQGMVVDPEGLPVMGARVSLDRAERARTATTTEDGRFSVARPSKAGAVLCVDAEGFLEYRKVLGSVEEAQESLATVVLQRGLGVRVVPLYHGTRLAQSRAELRFAPTGHRVPEPRTFRPSAGDSRSPMEVWGLREGRLFGYVRSGERGSASIGVLDVEVRQDSLPVEAVVEMVDPVDVSGIVVDEEGLPLAGARVWAESSEMAGLSGVLVSIQRALGAAEEVRTTEDGLFSLRGLHPRDSLLVVAAAEGYETRRLPLAGLGLGFLSVELRARD